MKDKVWVYDIETISNLLSYSAMDRDSDEKVSFVIWKQLNQLPQLLKHLDSCKGQISFNGNAFDYPVLHFIMKNRDKLLTYTGDRTAKLIYKVAQDTIQKEWSQIREPYIPQLDLFKMWHFDNKARMTSLKKLEIALQFKNVQDMPHHHSAEITTQQQVDEILAYNMNDVEATKVFYTKSDKKLKLRKDLISKYKLPCINFSDAKIGEELMLKLYCEKTGKNVNVVRHQRTHRKSLRFRDCIPNYIEFKTEEFNGLLNYLKEIEVTELKGSFKRQFIFKDFGFDLGTGGIHGCNKAGVYEETEEECIIDADVGSLYPSLAIGLGIYPQHLGSEFPEIYYNEIIKPRLEAKKNGNKILADAFKLAANACYGKSNSVYSWLCDALYTVKTTLAGQLALCMLSERLMTQIPELKMLQINTDGLTAMIPVSKKRLYWNICKEWEAQTGLNLEYVAYKRMIIRDVNNYIGESKSGKVKYKGVFKPHGEMVADEEYHKAFSQGIVPIALSNYYTKGIPVEETIKNHTNIYDFMKTFNATHGWKCETVDDEGLNPKEQQKNNRYYISKEGRTFRKTKDVKIIEIEAEDKVIIFNKYEEKPFEDYKIDYNYYIKESYKIIDTISGQKERLSIEKKEKRESDKREREEENYIKFCMEKVPTQIQYNTHSRPWLMEKYGVPHIIKPSKVKDEYGEDQS